jgi:hypothetical protein
MRRAFINTDDTWPRWDTLRLRTKLVTLNGRRWGVWAITTEGGVLAELWSWKPGQSIRDRVATPMPVESARAIVEWVLATQEAA